MLIVNISVTVFQHYVTSCLIILVLESNLATDSEPEVAKKRPTRSAKIVEATPPISKRVAKLKNQQAEESSGR